jgi:hypothetical protein
LDLGYPFKEEVGIFSLALSPVTDLGRMM